VTPSAALVALCLVGCAGGDSALQKEVDSLRAELRTLQRENEELVRKVETLGSRLDVVAARPARRSGDAVEPAAGAAPAPSAAAPAAPLVPPRLKVVRLEAASAPPARTPPRAATAPRAGSAVPTDTPVRDPDPAVVASLGGGTVAPAASPQAALDAAHGQTGLARARSLEAFADRYPGHSAAGGALVEAARLRYDAGDPDGSCEDFARAVVAYPSGASVPDALVGMAACETRRGRPAEARRLEERLAKDYPDSPAASRARERAPAAQGAAP
jgi:TolA-binding protein